MGKKKRQQEPLTTWRLVWYQVVEGVTRCRWHTGPYHECEVLRQACLVTNEKHILLSPGTFWL